MTDHRVRLDDEELWLVVSSLMARAAGVSAARRAKLLRLAERLGEGKRGNPNFIFGWTPSDDELNGTPGR